jgi:hypothetical protein
MLLLMRDAMLGEDLQRQHQLAHILDSLPCKHVDSSCIRHRLVTPDHEWPR